MIYIYITDDIDSVKYIETKSRTNLKINEEYKYEKVKKKERERKREFQNK